MRIVLAILGLLLLATIPSTATHAPVLSGRYSVLVDGETALGWVAYPTASPPTTLLVFGHGCCGKPNQEAFVRSFATNYHVAAVAMDYRGPGGWDVLKGSEDLVAATLDLQARFPIARTVIWGVSMGGETTGMAVAARSDLYDYWVDTFGVTNLFEEFAALGHYPGLSPNPGNPSNPTGSAIVAETGGTPATAPEAYRVRSPALRTSEMTGLTRAYITHGIGDKIVPYSMSRETFEGLVANGVPASLTTILTRPGSEQGVYPICCGLPSGTPVATPAGPVGTPVGTAAHDGAGFGPTYAIVDALLRGREPDAGSAFREHVVDYTTGLSQATP